MTDTIREKLELFLAEKGLRRTKQRDMIIEAAFSSTDHFNADELHDRARKIDSSISRATVYRTLSLLVDCKLLHEVDLGRDQTYYDPNFLEKPEHSHLICSDCNRVVEFEDNHLSVLEDCVTRRLGFTPFGKSTRINASCNELARTGHCAWYAAREDKDA